MITIKFSKNKVFYEAKDIPKKIGKVHYISHQAADDLLMIFRGRLFGINNCNVRT